MSGIEGIQSAEATIAEMQEALTAVQTDLERAETGAVAAEEAKERWSNHSRSSLGSSGFRYYCWLCRDVSRSVGLPALSHSSLPEAQAAGTSLILSGYVSIPDRGEGMLDVED